MPSIGLYLIAKNEEKRLPDLLRSVEGAFDQVVLVDTGSIDRTKEVFLDWAAAEQKRNPEFAFKTDYFHWVEDFAAARNHAQSLLDTDWQVWSDCDDVIVGAQNLRRVAEQAPDHVLGFIAGYNYAQHPISGQCICHLRRERVVRRGVSKWVNRVHEAQIIEGPVMQVGRDVAEWIHQKQANSVAEFQAEDSRRNLDILDSWVKDEPTNTRVLAYLGTEYGARGEIETAINWFQEYLQQDPEWSEERAQVHRKIALCHLSKGEFDVAISHAMRAILLMPSWTDSYITLADAHFAKGDFEKAIEWAQEALRRGEPETMLIINPLDYSYQPRKILAGSLASLQRYEEAVKIGTEAFQMNPMDEGLANALVAWRNQAKLERTATTIGMLAQQLVQHDEQLKALKLLEECVPHFCAEHPGVVNLRSELRTRVQWIHDPAALLKHYEDGGSKPEDFLPDDKLDEVPASLPRTQFLYAGIHEQLAEAHRAGLIDAEIGEALPAILEKISG